MNKKILLLGSTGSIGTQALDVISRHPDAFTVEALAAFHSVDQMQEQIHTFSPRWVCMVDRSAARALRDKVNIPVLEGPEGLVELCRISQADMALVAIVGIAGLPAVMNLIDRGMDIALANKEALVTGGELVMGAARRRDVKILPVDSEHSAIFQCLQGGVRPQRLLLTASGGPFFGKTPEELAQVTWQQALNHPTWSMGSKITIDSATLMNKALEVIEARWLFDMPGDRIDVLVHRQSIVHSLVEFADHSVLAQLGCPDMRTAIQYALTWPYRQECPAPRLDLLKISALEFFPPDREAFPCLDLGYQALAAGEGATVVLNAANEVAVDAFLRGRIGFMDIPKLVEQALEKRAKLPSLSLENILALDRETRQSLGKLRE